MEGQVDLVVKFLNFFLMPEKIPRNTKNDYFDSNNVSHTPTQTHKSRMAQTKNFEGQETKMV